MHLFAATSEPSNSRIFKSLAAHPEARTKFVGYKTFYLFRGVITQSQPGHPTLITTPEALCLRYDFCDRERTRGGHACHTPDPAMPRCRSGAQRDGKAEHRIPPAPAHCQLSLQGLEERAGEFVPLLYHLCRQAVSWPSSLPFQTPSGLPRYERRTARGSLITFLSPDRANLSEAVLQFPASIWPKCIKFTIA